MPAAEFSDAPPEAFSPPSSKLNLDGHEGAIAFASLLEAPADTGEIEPVVTANRDASLGEPAFWTHPEETEATGEEPAADEFTTDHAWTSGEREAPVQGEAPLLSPLLQEFEPLAETARGDASVTEQTQETPARASDFLAPHGLLGARDATADTAPLQQDPALWETTSLEESFAGEPAATLSPTEGPLISPALIVSATSQSENAPGEDEFPAPKQADDAAGESWAVPGENVPTKRANPAAEAHAEPLLEAFVEWPPVLTPGFSPRTATPALPVEPVSDTQPITGPAESRRDSAPAPAPVPAATPAPATTPAPAAAVSPEVIEAMVQRVIAQMQPQIDNLTRELLRPAVESLIRRELEKQ